MKNHMIPLVMLAVFAFVAFAFMPVKQDASWKAPAEYAKKANPVDADDESLELGEELWMTHCKSCHGKEGLGDGSKAAQLDTPAGDFSSDEFQDQSDGTIFYKSKYGRDEMPSYEKKIPNDNDIWHLVNFMRTMGE